LSECFDLSDSANMALETMEYGTGRTEHKEWVAATACGWCRNNTVGNWELILSFDEWMLPVF
jgi:hypothetical protein